MKIQETLHVIRDPLWGNVSVEPLALACLDTPTFQRLRYVRQLGHAFLVYPGAAHSRFEHALGAYHLASRALVMLDQRGELEPIDESDRLAVRLAALLHDIGHYPYSHALEEAGLTSHETLGANRLAEGELGTLLRAEGGGALITKLGELMLGTSTNPLAGLISGSIDLDKIDYLSRDARNCGVPYGVVDVDRLLASLTMVRVDGALHIGVHRKGISALESLLFAKYQMYRNVYWHHAVRSATCMFKRAVRATITGGALTIEQIAHATDGALDALLLEHDPTGLARAVRDRRLYKRALELPASAVPDRLREEVFSDVDAQQEAEDRLAEEFNLPPGGVLIDFPARESMLSVDLPLRTGGHAVEQLTDAGRPGELGLPRVADELYRSARRLRIFTVKPHELDRIPLALIQ